MSATDDLVYGHAEGAAAVRVCCRTITACLLARHLRSSAPRHIMQQCFTLVAYLHRCYPHYMVPGAGEQLLQELLVHRVMACFADGVRGLAGAAAGAEAELEAFAVGQCRKVSVGRAGWQSSVPSCMGRMWGASLGCIPLLTMDAGYMQPLHARGHKSCEHKHQLREGGGGAWVLSGVVVPAECWKALNTCCEWVVAVLRGLHLCV